jgi:hypothetical protein
LIAQKRKRLALLNGSEHFLRRVGESFCYFFLFALAVAGFALAADFAFAAVAVAPSTDPSAPWPE